MNKSFNDLSPAEAERLAMLIEEAAEVQHVAAKILRHGWESCNPLEQTGETNRDKLKGELRDLFAVHLLMVESGDGIEMGDLQRAVQKKLRWSHHQVMEPKP
jgi:hypothetical protein